MTARKNPFVCHNRSQISSLTGTLFALALLIGVATDASAQGSISGRVTGPGAVPLPHPVPLQIYDLNGNGNSASITTTDASGNYSINLPASSYAIFTQNVDGYINEIYDNVQCSIVCNL